MSTQIFVNLPVRDLQASKAFFNALGYATNPTFTNDDAACIVVSDTIYVMLLTEPFFQGFTRKAIGDARTHTEVILCLSAETRAGVDALADRALAAGGRETLEAKDYGFMYQRSFQDLDGHQWEVVHMDEGAMPAE
jgi:predicted lactoylglutathione lyase